MKLKSLTHILKGKKTQPKLSRVLTAEGWKRRFGQKVPKSKKAASR